MRVGPNPLACVLMLAIVFSTGYSLGAELRVPGEFETIQKALDAAGRGDTVLVGPGRYVGCLRLKPGVVLRSVGDDSASDLTFADRPVLLRALRTVIDAGGRSDGPVVTGADGAVLDGFTVTGLGKVDHHKPGHAHAVECRGVSPRIVNNLVLKNGSTGIGSHNRGDKTAAAYIAKNFVVRNQGIGIGNNQGSKAIILDNVVCNNHEAGIGSRNGAKPTIVGNVVFENGFGYSRGPEKNPVTGGAFWPGIGARDGASPFIAGNEVFRNAMTGIGTTKAYSTILGNHVHHNRLTGIGVQEASSVVISGNRCHDNGRPGIGVVGSTALVVDNEIGFNGKNAGMGILSGSSVMAYDNRVKGAGTAGIAVIDASAVLFRNAIEKAGTAGIMVTGSKPVTVEENRITASGTVGILAQGQSLTIRRNRITDCIHHGVLVSGKKGVVIIEENTITGNGRKGGAGIFSSARERVRLGKNSVKNNGRLGDVVVGGKKSRRRKK
ncbi:MAG: right-handed parallel beta-helix repeat-containing protein [Planctomycetota bacterium]